MAWSSLASNQMVTFTNAADGGFSLNSGQSHVTSNKCMTKDEALTKYNLDASAMSSYGNNQLVPKSTWVAGTAVGTNVTITACATDADSTGQVRFYAYSSIPVNTTVTVNIEWTGSYGGFIHINVDIPSGQTCGTGIQGYTTFFEPHFQTQIALITPSSSATQIYLEGSTTGGSCTGCTPSSTEE